MLFVPESLEPDFPLGFNLFGEPHFKKWGHVFLLILAFSASKYTGLLGFA